MAKDTGGWAFPAFEPIDHWDKDSEKYRESMLPVGGMTLRDYFAAKALQGRLAGCMNQDGDSSDMEAVICYQIADAMLKARKS